MRQVCRIAMCVMVMLEAATFLSAQTNHAAPSAVTTKDHKMTMVATDGRRLALVDEEVDVSEKSQGDFIVPSKTVNELNRLLQENGEVEIRFAENQASFNLKA